MSLAERLSAGKSHLSATMTKIRTVDGEVYVEKNGMMGQWHNRRKKVQGLWWTPSSIYPWHSFYLLGYS